MATDLLHVMQLALKRLSLRQRPLLEAVRQTGRFLYRGEALSPRGGIEEGGSRAVVETPDLLDEGWCQGLSACHFSQIDCLIFAWS